MIILDPNMDTAYLWASYRSSLDPIYRSGVEAAPVWKALVGQKEDIF